METIHRTTRRTFLRLLTAASATFASSGQQAEAQNHAAKAIPEADLFRTGEETAFILLYPGFTALDAIGPEYPLSCMIGARVRFVAKSAKPVATESGFLVSPHLTFDEMPERASLFLVPGGTKGTADALADAGTIDFVRRAGQAAELVASVCTGSLLLGAAGLLDGYEATSHWQTLELLPIVGAKPSRKRVVFDRNRATAAGVTAGIDLAFELVRRYRGALYAKGVQLLGEYDPQPLFGGAGNPATADPRLVSLLNEMHKPFIDRLGETIRLTRDRRTR